MLFDLELEFLCFFFVEFLYKQEICHRSLDMVALCSFQYEQFLLAISLYETSSVALHIPLIEAVTMAALSVYVHLIESQRLVRAVHIVTCVCLLDRQDSAT